ncbi:MAG TPA: sulfatase-like hydrolase/transferase [Natronosporangium sp.]|nr:sulfatase-like hydrolase/transferase [Natronosporangium sp.]
MSQAAPAGSEEPTGPERRSAPARLSERWAFVEIFALCGFVVVQPLLNIIGGSPDFFIFHGVTPAEVALLVLVFCTVPPVGLWGLGALTRLIGPRTRWATHLATVGLLVAMFAVELGKQLTPVRGVLLAVLALLIGGVLTVGFARYAAGRHLVRFAAVGPLVFTLLFTFASPASAMILPGERPGAGVEAREVGPHPPIVMIILDELALLSLLDADGEVDAERFPHIARLAGDSTWWRNASTVAGWTPYALPAMLTGRMPAEHVAPHYALYPDNLFTLLGPYYQIYASESIAQLCPPWYCGTRAEAAQGGLPVALSESAQLLAELVSPVDPARDPYDDFAEPTVAERLGQAEAARNDRPEFRFRQALAASQPVRFHEFMSRLAQEAEPGEGVPGAEEGAAAKPALHFLHLLLPHTPWTYLPDGMRYQNLRGVPVDGPWWGRLALQRHLAQLQYADALIGETLGLLERTGRYDDALIILTADHGVALTPGPPDGSWVAGQRELGRDNLGAEEVAWVPLFIKEPGQTEGVVDERNWQHVDLLPTVADYAGVEVPWEVDGISWLRQERTSTDKPFVSELDDVRVLDGPVYYQRIMADPMAIPPVLEPPLPELVGTPVEAHPRGPRAGWVEVDNADAFQEVDLDSGVVPALVHGTLASSVPGGTPLAIAVNGTIGAVVPVVAEGADRRFGALIEDTSLFVPGENRLELFVVTDGATLQQLG